MEETHHSHAVANVGALHAFYLERILYRLGKSDGSSPEYSGHARLLHGLEKLVIKGGLIHKNTHSARLGEEILKRVVALQTHSVLGKLFKRALGIGIFDTLLEHKPESRIVGYQQIADYQRVVFDIRSPHIKRPGNLVEGREKYPVTALRAAERAQHLQFVCAGPAGIDGKDRRLRDGRPVGPEYVYKVR